MALTDLTQKILADAENEATRLVSHGAETVAQIEHTLAENVARLQQEYTIQTESLVAQELALAQQRTQREMRAIVESAKRSLLNDTYACALDQVLGLPDKEYARYIEGPLTKMGEVTAEHVQNVYVPLKRMQVSKEVCARVGLQAPLKARDDVQGGFVAVGDLSEYDARLEQRMLQVQRVSESKIADILFAA